jgi:chromosome segregation ATPase
MNVLSDRYLEQFQYKVQQKINLADDEIHRLSTYLSSVKGEICDVKDQLNRKTLQTTQLSQEISGQQIRYRVGTGTLIAKMRLNHHETMRESQDRYQQEINALRRSFEESLAGLEQLAQKKISSKSGPIDELISQASAQYDTLQQYTRSSHSSTEFHNLDDSDFPSELDYSHERRLESVLQTRNQERLDSLLKWKNRLADCVTILEEMEKDHSIKMAAFKVQLQDLETRFTASTARVQERHQQMTQGLKEKAENLEKRAEGLQKTIKKVERHHKRQLENAVQKGDSVAAESSFNERKVSTEREERSEIRELRAKREELKSRLESRDNELCQLRANNESMKREVARLRYEARHYGGK